MLMYKSGSTGEEILLSGEHIKAHIKTAGFHDYTWELDETERIFGSKVNGFSKKSVTYQLTLDYVGRKDQRAESAERFYALTEEDIRKNTAGKLIYNDTYIECFILGSRYQKIERSYAVRKEYDVYTPYPFWISENTYQFFSYDTIASSDNKRYPGSYPYRYANGLSNAYIQNPHFTDANFLLRIYGPAVNPQVSIGGIPYLVNIVLEAGERLEIDSRSETVIKIMNDGTQANAFHNRQKRRTFFRKIPPGRQSVVWPGSFDWDLIIYEERSEPKWNG